MSEHLKGLRAGLTPGYNALLDRTSDAAVAMDFGVERVLAGETREVATDRKTERAVLVVSGRGTLTIEDASGGVHTLAFARASFVEEGPFAAHGPLGARFTVEAETDCELAVLGTDNPKTFATRTFTPSEVSTEHRGKGILGDTAYRLVRLVFDRSSAPPEAMLVLGEVVTLPGRWSSYPPHHHAQPEIYYYRFQPEHGYGHGELGENVHLLRDRDLLKITGGVDHAQVSAPGYHMYYLWAIRHLAGHPYTGFEYNPDHAALAQATPEPKKGA
jgi:5-deoxy-glucuronate isomerase